MTSRKQSVLDAIRMMQRGVQQPVVIVRSEDDANDFDAIPNAYLNDISYEGSTDVVHEITEDGFGPEFSYDDAEDLAEWAANEWTW